ncbi:ATP synthase F1 complex assembly factor [Perilla frutescens var. hirtella]|nr:ATP synthase F1 complex assembly factor [Perilla frutescens var. hirtella]
MEFTVATRISEFALEKSLKIATTTLRREPAVLEFFRHGCGAQIGEFEYHRRRRVLDSAGTLYRNASRSSVVTKHLFSTIPTLQRKFESVQKNPFPSSLLQWGSLGFCRNLSFATGFTPLKVKPLETIMDVERAKKKSPEELADIWDDFYLGRGHIGLSMKSKLYHLLDQRAADCRYFVIPLWKGSGYSTMFVQDYKARGTQAAPYLTASYYKEFVDSKDLVLVRGDVVFTSKLSDEEAKWLLEAAQSFYLNDVRHSGHGFSLSRNGRPDTKKIQDLFHQIDKDNSTSISAAELRVLLLGVRMDEEPLINSVVSFATATNLPNFSVGYLAIPLAMNYRVAVQTITLSRERSHKSISLTLSALYSGVYMNNIYLYDLVYLEFLRAKRVLKKKSLMFEEKLSQLKDTGTRIDKKTCYTAGIMLLSLIPYTIVQTANVFDSSFGTRWLTLDTELMLDFDPWIQERSLEYSKYENLLVGFLQHAKEKLIDESGQPNIPVIKELVYQTDKDADRSITFHELESLILEIQSGKKPVEKGYAISQMLKTFDRNKDGRIEEHEFIDGCLKWINEATYLAEKADLNAQIARERQVVQPVSKKRRLEKAEIEHLMARILNHAQSDELEAENYLVKDDGELNVERIKGLFKKFDTDRSNSLSRSELEELIQTTVRTGDSQLNHQEMEKKFMKDFDNIVDEQEFVHGMTKWLNKAMDVTKCIDAKKSIDEFDKA